MNEHKAWKKFSHSSTFSIEIFYYSVEKVNNKAIIDKRIGVIYTLQEVEKLPTVHSCYVKSGDKPAPIEEVTANSAMALRSSDGFTVNMTKPWVLARFLTNGPYASSGFLCVFSIFLT